METPYRVCCVSIPTLGAFNNASFFAQQFRLREIEYNQKLGWGRDSWQGHLYDDLDTPAAQYFIVRDGKHLDDPLGDVVGVARLVPTMCPTGYMLKNSFQHAVKFEPLPQSPDCWEGSVAVTNDRLPKTERTYIFSLFAAAYLEFLVSQKASWMYGIALEKIWQRWGQSGWPVEPIGPTVQFDDGTEGTAGKMPVSQEWLEKARTHVGIKGDILEYGDPPERRALAFSEVPQTRSVAM